jgi:hypothetical protein
MAMVRVWQYARQGRGCLATIKGSLVRAGKRLDQVWSGFVRRLNILSMDRPVKTVNEVLLLTVAPMLTMGLVCAATSVVGETYQTGCNSFSNFLDDLLLRSQKPSTCVAIPFLSDVPTILLSITCPFAMVAYHLVRRRLNWLIPAVSGTGLVNSELAAELAKGVHKMERTVDLNRPRKVTFFLITTAMTIWLYWRYLNYGKLFTILANGRFGPLSESALRAGWWANYHYHPFLAAVCIFIGSVGIYYALRAGWLYLMLGQILITSRKSKMTTPEFNYVPQWRDRSYGWSPVTGGLFLIYVSTINFVLSMIAVFDMLQGREWTIGVAAFFAALGVVSNIIIVVVPLIRIVAAHRAVGGRLRNQLIQESANVAPSANILTYTVAASDLAVWRRIPVASLSGSALKIIPGLYAFIAFIVRVIFAKH